MFWSDVGEQPRIEKVDMDGNRRQAIVNTDIFYPISLVVDYMKDNRLYWADPKKNRIESILPDGSDRKIIICKFPIFYCNLCLLYFNAASV